MDKVYVVTNYEECECEAVFTNEKDATEYLLSIAQELQYEVYYLVYGIIDYSLIKCVSHYNIHEMVII